MKRSDFYHCNLKCKHCRNWWQEQYFYEHQCYDRKSWFCDKMRARIRARAANTAAIYNLFIYSFSFNQHCYLLLQSVHINSKRDNISDFRTAEHSSALSLVLTSCSPPSCRGRAPGTSSSTARWRLENEASYLSPRQSCERCLTRPSPILFTFNIASLGFATNQA